MHPAKPHRIRHIFFLPDIQLTKHNNIDPDYTAYSEQDLKLRTDQRQNQCHQAGNTKPLYTFVPNCAHERRHKEIEHGISKPLCQNLMGGHRLRHICCKRYQRKCIADVSFPVFQTKSLLNDTGKYDHTDRCNRRLLHNDRI